MRLRRQLAAVVAISTIALLAALPAPAQQKGQTKKPGAKKTAKAAPGKETPAEAIYDPLLRGDWAIDDAARKAASSKRRLLINFGTNDCGACRTVAAAFYEEAFLKAAVVQFFPVFVDVTPGTPNAKLLEKFGIDPAKGLPAVVLSDKELQPVETTKEGELAAAAAKGEKAVQEWFLKRFLTTEENR